MKKVLIILSAVFCAGAFAQNYQWAKKISGQPANSSRIISSIAVDSAGCSYVFGHFTGTADFDPGPNTANHSADAQGDLFLAKYDAAGNYLWAKVIVGPSWGVARSIELDASGNILVAGYYRVALYFTHGTNTNTISTSGLQAIFFAKFDANGNYLWAKSVDAWYVGHSMFVDATGNFYLTGHFQGVIDFDPGPGVANLNLVTGRNYLAKYDPNGNYVWAKNIGNYFQSENGHGITVDNSGNVYVTGYHGGTADFDPGPGTYTLASAGSGDIYLAKYDMNGNLSWAHNFGGPLDDQGYSVCLDTIGNVCLTGFFRGTVDFDPGSLTATLTSAGGADIFFAKYDANGNYIWAKRAGGINDDAGICILNDKYDNLYLNGYYSTSAVFDQVNPTASLTPAGTYTQSIFLAKYDPNGNYLFAKGIGAHIEYANVLLSPFVGLTSMAVKDSGDIFIANYFSGTADFDPGVNTASLVSAVNPYFMDAFIAKYSAIACVAQTVNNPQKICAGDTYIFMGSTYTASGVYTHTLQTKSGCDSLIVTQLTVNPSPVIGISASTTICENSSAVLTAGGANSYTWSTNQNNASIMVSPGVTTVYSVRGTDANGCISSNSLMIYVDPCAGIPQAGDAEDAIAIFPNPVRETITVKLNESGSVKYPLAVQIMNLHGQVIFSEILQNISADRLMIDAFDLSRGIYFIKVGDKVSKVVKE